MELFTTTIRVKDAKVTSRSYSAIIRLFDEGAEEFCQMKFEVNILLGS